MFNIGDTVLYANDGVCRITEMTVKEFGDISVEYYVLTPVFDECSTIFVPTKNQKLVSRMHYVHTPDEIKRFIYEEPEDCWIENDVSRSDRFKCIITSGDLKLIINLTKSILSHKNDILLKGKKLHKSDELIYKDCIKLMYEEISLFYKITKDDIEDIIKQKITLDDLVKNV